MGHRAIRAQKRTHMALIDCGHTTLEQKPLQSRPYKAMRCELPIEGHGLIRLDLDVALRVIMQVFAHTGLIADHLDPERAQVLARPDTGEHQ